MFSATTVRAEGVTAGAQTVCWSVAQTGRGYDFNILREMRTASDDDRDGVVTFDRGKSTAFHSIWVVADLSSGEVSIATPSGFEQKLDIRVTTLRPGKDGKLAALALRSQAIDILLVRARVGAWRGFAAEGGKRDKDGARDGQLSLDIEQFASVGRSPAVPQHFVPGDVLVLIQPRTMEFTSITVTPEGAR